jgi:hypothetical protein
VLGSGSRSSFDLGYWAAVRSRQLSVLVVFSLAGCDVVFGLSGEPSPCALESFDTATPSAMMSADELSFTPDGFGVVVVNSFAFEIDPAGEMLPIDLEPAGKTSFGIVPEGDLVFFSLVYEPHELRSIVRTDNTWERDVRLVPAGTFAGGASSLVFGPRRVLVRLYDDVRADVQEYEDNGRDWVPVGTPFRIHDVGSAPSLTENGLTLVMRDFDADNNTIITAANRDSLDDAFPVDADGFVRTTTILSASVTPGPHSPQLFGRKTCDELWVSSGGQVVRYER